MRRLLEIGVGLICLAGLESTILAETPRLLADRVSPLRLEREAAPAIGVAAAAEGESAMLVRDAAG